MLSDGSGDGSGDGGSGEGGGEGGVGAHTSWPHAPSTSRPLAEVHRTRALSPCARSRAWNAPTRS